MGLFYYYGGKKMNIIQEVENLLKAEYAEGLTQEELAARHHVRQQ